MKRLMFPSLVVLLGISPLAVASPSVPPTKPIATKLSEQEKAKTLNLPTSFLRRSIDVRKDGTAAGLHARSNFRARIEWRNLVFRQLIYGSVSSTDRKNRITRRLYA